MKKAVTNQKSKRLKTKRDKQLEKSDKAKSRKRSTRINNRAWKTNEKYKAEKEKEMKENKSAAPQRRVKEDHPDYEGAKKITVYDKKGGKKKVIQKFPKDEQGKKTKTVSTKTETPEGTDYHVKTKTKGEKTKKVTHHADGTKSVATQHKTNSWEEEDVKRGRKFAAEGKMGHAEALFDDAHGSYNWKGGNDGREHWRDRFNSKSPVSQLKGEMRKVMLSKNLKTGEIKEELGPKKPVKTEKITEAEFNPKGDAAEKARKAEEDKRANSEAARKGGYMFNYNTRTYEPTPNKAGAERRKKSGFPEREEWEEFKQDHPEHAPKPPSKRFKDFDQMDTWDAESIAKQTPFENLIQKYPDMPASDTLPANDPRENMGWPTAYSEDLNKAFNDTYGNTEGWEIEDGDITDAEARAKAQEEKKKKDEALKTQAVKDSLYKEHLKTLQEQEGDNLPTFAPTKQHGQSKGDQSATHTDYANYKGTDKGYHGRTGASHGDQSATHRDYAHPILKHMKR